MKKLGRASILDILERAKKEFIADHDALYFVEFNYGERLVIAIFDPVPDDIGWIVSRFQVVYSRCVMTYTLGVDYDFTDAYFYD